MSETKLCSQKQRRYILYIWHQIKLSDREESMWLNIEKIIKRPKEDFWNEERGKYELNWLSNKEAYKITTAFLAQQRQNKSRGVNVVIKNRTEFAQPCQYCEIPIYWAVASMNERIPVELHNGKYHWHKCTEND